MVHSEDSPTTRLLRIDIRSMVIAISVISNWLGLSFTCSLFTPLFVVHHQHFPPCYTITNDYYMFDTSTEASAQCHTLFSLVTSPPTCVCACFIIQRRSPFVLSGMPYAAFWSLMLLLHLIHPASVCAILPYVALVREIHLSCTFRSLWLLYLTSIKHLCFCACHHHSFAITHISVNIWCICVRKVMFAVPADLTCVFCFLYLYVCLPVFVSVHNTACSFFHFLFACVHLSTYTGSSIDGASLQAEPWERICLYRFSVIW